jgi:hypothetical protein
VFSHKQGGHARGGFELRVVTRNVARLLRRGFSLEETRIGVELPPGKKERS